MVLACQTSGVAQQCMHQQTVDRSCHGVSRQCYLFRMQVVRPRRGYANASGWADACFRPRIISLLLFLTCVIENVIVSGLCRGVLGLSL
jgi:hypothetical protein